MWRTECMNAVERALWFYNLTTGFPAELRLFAHCKELYTILFRDFQSYLNVTFLICRISFYITSSAPSSSEISKAPWISFLIWWPNTYAKPLQSCPTLSDFMDHYPPPQGSSVHEILQAEYWSGLPFPSPATPICTYFMHTFIYKFKKCKNFIKQYSLYVILSDIFIAFYLKKNIVMTVKRFHNC